MTLLTNAAQAAGPGRRDLSLTAAAGAKLARQRARLGPGVPADLSTKIFDPFFTTKDVGEGRAAACRSRTHRALARGRIELGRLSPGRGAEFIVWLPLIPPAELLRASRPSRRLSVPSPSPRCSRPSRARGGRSLRRARRLADAELGMLK